MSKASQWKKEFDNQKTVSEEHFASRPKWKAKKTQSFTSIPAHGSVDCEGNFSLNPEQLQIAPEQCLDLAKWLVETFGEK